MRKRFKVGAIASSYNYKSHKKAHMAEIERGHCLFMASSLSKIDLPKELNYNELPEGTLVEIKFFDGSTVVPIEKALAANAKILSLA